MVTAKDNREHFPHIRFREVEGRSEPYLDDSGLAIWEIAWLSRSYGGDARAIAANHTVVGPELIEEGLRFATEHAEEIEAEIVRHTERPLEELLELLPGMRVITIDVSEPDGQRP
jgi:3',5'-cyclic AMP phosphodiesterase CpdA